MKTVITALVLVLWSFSIYAKPTFEGYTLALKEEARALGYSEHIIEQAFSNITYRKRAVKADRNQPERKITLDTYLATRVPDWKVKQAIDIYNENKDLLERVEKHFNVQARFIVALWGNESNFGKITGKYPVISALATLAYDGRREALFKKELFSALQILKEGHIQHDQFLGSWAGAMGQSQFLPSSFLNYAYDFDQDGKKDIWGNKADIFASIANYLKSEGWDGSATWGRQVRLPDNVELSVAGLDKTKSKTLMQWQALGYRKHSGEALPKRNLKANLIIPDDENGRIYLVYNNFQTLMRWNRSLYFGVAVSYLADRIKFAR
jgi:membrane-bound lytic murein transglycosylase B